MVRSKLQRQLFTRNVSQSTEPHVAAKYVKLGIPSTVFSSYCFLNIVNLSTFPSYISMNRVKSVCRDTLWLFLSK